MLDIFYNNKNILLLYMFQLSLNLTSNSNTLFNNNTNTRVNNTNTRVNNNQSSVLSMGNVGNSRGNPFYKNMLSRCNNGRKSCSSCGR